MPLCKILIVEDEILVAKTLQMYLEERGHVVSDIAISYDEAVESLERDPPDLALLDIKLYGNKSGILFAEKLNSLSPQVPFIFLTSQMDKKILDKAFHTNPHGYLIKPIQKQTLWASVELAIQKVKATREGEKIKLVDGNNIYFQNILDILYIKVDHVYISIYSNSGVIRHLRMGLKEILGLLEGNNFAQCHRSYIVNLDHITNFGRNKIIVSNIEIPVSRTYKNQIKDKL